MSKRCCNTTRVNHTLFILAGYIVHNSASEKDIRAAYKRLSKKYHPDKNKDPGAEDRFVDIARGEWQYYDATSNEN